MGNNISNNILISYFENINLDTFTTFENFPFSLYLEEIPNVSFKYYSYVIDGKYLGNNINQQVDLKIYKILLTDDNIVKNKSFQLIYLIEDKDGNFYKPNLTNNNYINNWIQTIYSWNSNNSNIKISPYNRNKLKILTKRKIYFQDDLINPYAEINDDGVIKKLLINIINILSYDKNYYFLENTYNDKIISSVKCYFYISDINYTILIYDDYISIELFNNNQIEFILRYFYNKNKILLNYSRWFFKYKNLYKFMIFIKNNSNNNLSNTIIENEYNIYLSFNEDEYFTGDYNNLLDVSDNIILNNIYLLLVKFKKSIDSIINLNYSKTHNDINNLFVKDLGSIIEITNKTMDNIKNNSSLNELLTMMKNIDYTDLLFPDIKNELCGNSINLFTKYKNIVNKSDDIIIILRYIVKGFYFFEINTIETNTLIKYYFQIGCKNDTNGVETLIYFEHEKFSDKKKNNESCKNAILKYFQDILLKIYPNKNIIFFDLDTNPSKINKISFNLNFDFCNDEYDFNFV